MVYYLLSLLEAESKRNNFRIEVAVTLTTLANFMVTQMQASYVWSVFMNYMSREVPSKMVLTVELIR